MKITKGKWKARNGKEIEIEFDKDGYYAIVGKDRLYYDEDGQCYRDTWISGDIDHKKSFYNALDFQNWDIVECMEEIIPIKRSTNPILTLDLCTE